MAKWIAKIDHVDWRAEPDLSQREVVKLYNKYHNKEVEVECSEETIEALLRERIKEEAGRIPDEVEFSYRAAPLGEGELLTLIAAAYLERRDVEDVPEDAIYELAGLLYEAAGGDDDVGYVEDYSEVNEGLAEATEGFTERLVSLGVEQRHAEDIVEHAYRMHF